MSYSPLLDDKIILVTGGTGSFGYQVIKKLSNYNPKLIIVYSRDEEKHRIMSQEFEKTSIGKKIKFVIGDVRDYDRLFATSKNVDMIFHAAALKQVPAIESHPFEAVKTNIMGAYNIVKAATARKVKNVIAISTDKAVKPVNAMGMTKSLQEKIIIADDLEKDGTIFACVRYGNVLGSRGSVIPMWDDKFSKNEPLPITHPEMTRFLLTLNDAIDLVFYSLKHAKGGEIFVKKASASKITTLAKAYAKFKTGEQNYPLEFVGIRPGEKIHEVLVSQEEMRHVKEKKDHFVIYREDNFDKILLKKSIQTREYSSNNVKQLNTIQLIDIIKKIHE